MNRQPCLSDLPSLYSDVRRLTVELEWAKVFIERVQEAHELHLRTGDYSSLGMRTQDALLAYEKGPTDASD